MHPLKVPAAFDRWHLDFVGELPRTLKGNRWLLIAVDYATNWPIARAVPVANAVAIADFIYDEIVLRFGCPSEILTDRGANFNSLLVNAYLKKVGAHHKLTSAYHPRTNSKVERFNGVFKNMLRKYVNGALRRWDDFVNTSLWACRVRVHKTTGYSPYFLTYGREPRLPGDTLQPYIDKSTAADPRTVADLTSRELARLGNHRAAAEFKMKAMAEQDKVKWDARVKPIEIEVGDKVMLTHEGRLSLEPNYKGPYVVTQCFPDFGTYKLATLTGEPLQSLVHADRLKLAKGIDISEPWYDPVVARREWKAGFSRCTLIPNTDHVDPIRPISVSPIGSAPISSRRSSSVAVPGPPTANIVVKPTCVNIANNKISKLPVPPTVSSMSPLIGVPSSVSDQPLPVLASRMSSVPARSSMLPTASSKTDTSIRSSATPSISAQDPVATTLSPGSPFLSPSVPNTTRIVDARGRSSVSKGG